MLRYRLITGILPKRQSDNCIFDVGSNPSNIIAIMQNVRQVDDVAPFPMGLLTSVKITMADEDDFKYYKSVPNYMVVEQYKDPTAFWLYFITDTQRVSNSVIELTLSLDTLNTFSNRIKNALRDERTFIYREHVDRFMKYHPDQSTTAWYPVIDYIDEGFSLLQYKVSDTKIEENYLPFTEQMQCFLLINSKTYQMVYPSYEDHQVPNLWYGEGSDEEYWDVVERSGDYQDKTLNVGIIFDRATKGYRLDSQSPHDPREMDFVYLNKDADFKSHIPLGSQAWYSTMQYYIQQHGATPLEKIDLATESIVKVKAIPYPPTSVYFERDEDDNTIKAIFNIDGPTYDLIRVPSDGYGTGRYAEIYTHGATYYYNNARQGFYRFPKRVIASRSVLEYSNFYNDSRWLNPTAVRFVRDPKTYNSSFYTLKYVYAETSYELKLENCATPSNGSLARTSLDLTISYQVTFSISGDFLFEIAPRYGFAYKTSDYEGVLVVSDACEVSLVSDDYINYMRAGYNYDQVKHDQEMSKAITTSILATAGGAVGGLLATGGNPVGAIVGAAIGATSSVLSIGFTEAIWETERNKKLAQLAQDAPALSQSKNGELLFDTYGNRLREIIYEPRAEEEEKLERLFHLYGYKRNLYKPANVDTRYWFNFVQCEPYLEDHVPSFACGDVRSKLADGVTFYHYHNGYDIMQTKENWEVSLL